MTTSYLKIALRHLARNKLHSFINIAGLSLGLGCAMLILLFTKDELSFDRFHSDANSIYQVTIDVRFPDGSSMDKFAVTSSLLGPALSTDLPEIESFLRMQRVFWDLKLGDKVQSQSVLLTDSNFFSMLTFPLIHGNNKTALRSPGSVVISEDMAIRHFGTVDALNKPIMFERGGTFHPYTVTGVAKRPPQNSSIQFEAVLPFTTTSKGEQRIDNWVSVDVNTLLKLSKGSDPEVVSKKIQQVFERASIEAFVPVRKSGFMQVFHHRLQPLTETHLNQEFKAENGFTNGSDPMYSYILSCIALFLLTIACINFINLTVAQSMRRAKEIGIRKVVGSGRRQLIIQFLGESFLLCCFSFIGGLLLVYLTLPLFNDLTNKALSLSFAMDVNLLVTYSILFIATTTLAGFYPAVVLSGYGPIQTLYHQFRLSGKNILQKGLVVFQFSLATLMILGTLTMYLQLDFLTNKDLGYDSNHLVRVGKKNLTAQEANTIREELKTDANIVSVAPHRRGSMTGKINVDTIRQFTYEAIGEDHVSMLGLKIVQGRDFSTQFPSDASNSVLVNEAFVRMARWKDPIGQAVDLHPFDGKYKTVIGVVKDYHYESLRKAIEPQLFAMPGDNEPYRQLLIRIAPGTETRSLQSIENLFRSLFPILPYTFQFEDEINRKNYESEARWKRVILLGSLLTILVSAIGLFGLTILTAEKRFKEIGIRKVLGASVRLIVFTLSKDFLSLILLAMLTAMPLAYYAGNRWLETYPYRPLLGPGVFVAAGALVVLLGLVTISYQSVKTALMNPVDALRRE